MSKDPGGNAFPIPGLHEDESFNGMTLRDYFAAKVLCTENNVGCPATQAKWAYEVADAMIAERAK